MYNFFSYYPILFNFQFPFFIYLLYLCTQIKLTSEGASKETRQSLTLCS